MNRRSFFQRAAAAVAGVVVAVYVPSSLLDPIKQVGLVPEWVTFGGPLTNAISFDCRVKKLDDESVLVDWIRVVGPPDCDIDASVQPAYDAIMDRLI